MRFMALPVPRQYDNHHIGAGDSFIMHVSRRPWPSWQGGIIFANNILDPLSTQISSNLRWGREPKGF